MNSKILLGVLVFMAMLCNAAQAASPFGPVVKKGNPWMIPRAHRRANKNYHWLFTSNSRYFG